MGTAQVGTLEAGAQVFALEVTLRRDQVPALTGSAALGDTQNDGFERRAGFGVLCRFLCLFVPVAQFPISP